MPALNVDVRAWQRNLMLKFALHGSRLMTDVDAGNSGGLCGTRRDRTGQPDTAGAKRYHEHNGNTGNPGRHLLA